MNRRGTIGFDPSPCFGFALASLAGQRRLFHMNWLSPQLELYMRCKFIFYQSEGLGYAVHPKSIVMNEDRIADFVLSILSFAPSSITAPNRQIDDFLELMCYGLPMLSPSLLEISSGPLKWCSSSTIYHSNLCFNSFYHILSYHCFYHILQQTGVFNHTMAQWTVAPKWTWEMSRAIAKPDGWQLFELTSRCWAWEGHQVV